MRWMAVLFAYSVLATADEGAHNASVPQTSINNRWDFEKVRDLFCPAFLQKSSGEEKFALAPNGQGQYSLSTIVRAEGFQESKWIKRMLTQAQEKAQSEIAEIAKIRKESENTHGLYRQFSLDSFALARRGGLENKDFDLDFFRSDSLYNHWVFKSKYFTEQKKIEFHKEIERLKGLRKSIQESEEAQIQGLRKLQFNKGNRAYSLLNIEWGVRLRELGLERFSKSTDWMKKELPQFKLLAGSLEDKKFGHLEGVLSFGDEDGFSLFTDKDSRLVIKSKSYGVRSLCQYESSKSAKIATLDDVLKRILEGGLLELTAEECEQLKKNDTNPMIWISC